MALCWNQDPTNNGGTGASVPGEDAWVECSQGVQWPGFWICTDVDNAACADGPFMHVTNTSSPAEMQAVLPDYAPVANSQLTAGTVASGGGGSESIWPQLTTADTAAIGAKVLMAFAVAFCIKLAYGVITGRR